jgi:hypothetical protein
MAAPQIHLTFTADGEEEFIRGFPEGVLSTDYADYADLRENKIALILICVICEICGYTAGRSADYSVRTVIFVLV